MKRTTPAMALPGEGETPESSGLRAQLIRLGLQTIAEWVENRQTLEALRELGVDYAQGYWIGRPLPRRAVSKALASSASISPSMIARPMSRRASIATSSSRE